MEDWAVFGMLRFISASFGGCAELGENMIVGAHLVPKCMSRSVYKAEVLANRVVMLRQ